VTIADERPMGIAAATSAKQEAAHVCVSASFDRALAEAASLLRELPRHRHAITTARQRFRQFTVAHPDTPARLLANARPGCDDTEYDILLIAPDGGTIAVSWHPDQGIPWTALYADHWAANFILTVNGANTSIQSALLYLNRVLNRRPDMMADLVARALSGAAVEASPPPLEESEIDKAVDEFRIANGLLSGAETQKWLDEMQLTMEALHSLVSRNLQVRKLRQGLTADRVRPYFNAHRSDFDRVTVMRFDALPQPCARTLAAEWPRRRECPDLDDAGLRRASGMLQTLYARDLAPELFGKTVGSVVGPVRNGRNFWVGKILRRHKARFDRQTRARIEELLFTDWLDEQKQKATIRWHWV
jgi:putative peptide maturation system protein